MSDIELVIKIPEEAKQAFDCAESNDLKGGYYDHGGVIGNAIKEGTPLPNVKADVLDKIRAEIKALSNANPSYWHSGDMVEREDVLDIIDKYKAESEELK